MAGGNWNAQNKVRPGVYINFGSKPDFSLNTGERGVVAICERMSWGETGTVATIEYGADTTPYCGYPISAPEARFLREIFKGTDRTAPPRRVLLYRPANGGTAASAEVAPLTITAKYPGKRGNDIKIVILENADATGVFTVKTIVDGNVKDEQTASTVADLKANDWVTFSGTGELSAIAGISLANGKDGESTEAGTMYADFLTAIEPYDFDVIIDDSADSTVGAAMVNFVERMNSQNGKYIQLVTTANGSNSRFVTKVTDGNVILDDGTELAPNKVCWWAGGAEAGAKYNQSLTYAQYPGAVTTKPLLTNEQIIDRINKGELVLSVENNKVRVEQDINCLTAYTPDISKIYHKNRVIRLCNTIANDIYKQFSENFIGVVNNNEEGRLLFKSAIVGYLMDIQSNQGIKNFVEEDVEVLPGNDIDSIIINLAIQPVDAIEKIYITITVS